MNLFLSVGSKSLQRIGFIVSHLSLGLLTSGEPLHKLRQTRREGHLDWSIGNPQSISQPLEVTGIEGLIHPGMDWERKLDCRGFSRVQGLHRDTFISDTNVPVNAPLVAPLSGLCRAKQRYFVAIVRTSVPQPLL